MNTELEIQFNKTVEYVNSLPLEGPFNLYDENRAILYGLYKRITIGKCSEKGGDQPYMTDFISRAKWEYWNKCNNITKEEAMVKYIFIINQLKEKYL